GALALARPPQDILTSPYLPHGEAGDRPGEVGAADELLDALTADAEEFLDLGSSHQLHDAQHSHDATSHLTSGQLSCHASHVTTSQVTTSHKARLLADEDRRLRAARRESARREAAQRRPYQSVTTQVDP